MVVGTDPMDLDQPLVPTSLDGTLVRWKHVKKIHPFHLLAGGASHCGARREPAPDELVDTTTTGTLLGALPTPVSIAIYTERDARPCASSARCPTRRTRRCTCRLSTRPRAAGGAGRCRSTDHPVDFDGRYLSGLGRAIPDLT
jgi:hypothetical protein